MEAFSPSEVVHVYTLPGGILVDVHFLIVITHFTFNELFTFVLIPLQFQTQESQSKKEGQI